MTGTLVLRSMELIDETAAHCIAEVRGAICTHQLAIIPEKVILLLEKMALFIAQVHRMVTI